MSTPRKILRARVTVAMRRQLAAKQKAAEPIIRLTAEELENTRNLIHAAHKSNMALVDAGAELDAARAAVKLAEQRLSNAQVETTRIHSELAPLIRRLPRA